MEKKTLSNKKLRKLIKKLIIIIKFREIKKLI